MKNSSSRRSFQISLARLFGLLSFVAVFAAMIGQLPIVLALAIVTFSLYILGVFILDVPIARFINRVAGSYGRSVARVLDWLLILATVIVLFVFFAVFLDFAA